MQRSYRYIFSVAGIAGLLTIAVISMGMVMARSSLAAQEDFFRGMSQVRVMPPEDPPRLNQESIDLALALFDIKVPEGVEHPTLDLSIVDRGLTTLTHRGKLIVTVGPGAFTSWGILGSTLAHEIEVHCNQNFAIIRLMDMFGLEGTHNAEREAYHHELAHADRFFLSAEDRLSIAQTMDYFYPETEGKEDKTFADLFSKSVSQWLARPIK